jgi:hypothetical protein
MGVKRLNMFTNIDDLIEHYVIPKNKKILSWCKQLQRIVNERQAA